MDTTYICLDCGHRGEDGLHPVCEKCGSKNCKIIATDEYDEWGNERYQDDEVD